MDKAIVMLDRLLVKLLPDERLEEFWDLGCRCLAFRLTRRIINYRRRRGFWTPENMMWFAHNYPQISGRIFEMEMFEPEVFFEIFNDMTITENIYYR